MARTRLEDRRCVEHYAQIILKTAHNKHLCIINKIHQNNYKINFLFFLLVSIVHFQPSSWLKTISKEFTRGIIKLVSLWISEQEIRLCINVRTSLSFSTLKPSTHDPMYPKKRSENIWTPYEISLLVQHLITTSNQSPILGSNVDRLSEK